jgi:hypothetical protein
MGTQRCNTWRFWHVTNYYSFVVRLIVKSTRNSFRDTFRNTSTNTYMNTYRKTFRKKIQQLKENMENHLKGFYKFCDLATSFCNFRNGRKQIKKCNDDKMLFTPREGVTRVTSLWVRGPRELQYGLKRPNDVCQMGACEGQMMPVKSWPHPRSDGLILSSPGPVQFQTGFSKGPLALGFFLVSPVIISFHF